uniref:(northern house mosquito) hypothetical protein n=1 Tax=Culex pipiens TaxID=7175 RepID=A0A8D8BM39_CULPI
MIDGCATVARTTGTRRQRGKVEAGRALPVAKVRKRWRGNTRARRMETRTAAETTVASTNRSPKSSARHPVASASPTTKARRAPAAAKRSTKRRHCSFPPRDRSPVVELAGRRVAPRTVPPPITSSRGVTFPRAVSCRRLRTCGERTGPGSAMSWPRLHWTAAVEVANRWGTLLADLCRRVVAPGLAFQRC